MRMIALLVGAVLAAACSRGSGDSPSSAPSAAPAAAPTVTAAATPTMTVPAVVATMTAAPHGQPTSGVCSALAQKCKTCPPGPIQAACNLAVNAGNLDPVACTNALNDKDIKASCH
jgi:hypothetical protein